MSALLPLPVSLPRWMAVLGPALEPRQYPAGEAQGPSHRDHEQQLGGWLQGQAGQDRQNLGMQSGDELVWLLCPLLPRV